MVDINVKIHFDASQSRLLEIAADLGGQQPNNEQIKSIFLHAAFGTMKRFGMGVIEDHHTTGNPPTIRDVERRLRTRKQKALNDLAKIEDELGKLNAMKLRPVKS